MRLWRVRPRIARFVAPSACGLGRSYRIGHGRWTSRWLVRADWPDRRTPHPAWPDRLAVHSGAQRQRRPRRQCPSRLPGETRRARTPSSILAHVSGVEDLRVAGRERGEVFGAHPVGGLRPVLQTVAGCRPILIWVRTHSDDMPVARLMSSVLSQRVGAMPDRRREPRGGQGWRALRPTKAVGEASEHKVRRCRSPNGL